jgi:hypothetical protein
MVLEVEALEVSSEASRRTWQSVLVLGKRGERAMELAVI